MASNTPVVEEPITETITESNTDEIVETLTNTDGDVIGYACREVLENNVAEPMDIQFYLDLLTPKANTKNNNKNTDGSTPTPQENAVKTSQQFLLRKMSEQYGIDPGVSKGIRCFDLPVDGSTWIVQMTIEPNFFVEETLFGGCRELEWDPESHDCKMYEAHMKGLYIGAFQTDQDGIPFSDAVKGLEKLISVDLPRELSEQLGGGLLGASNYETKFLGVPSPSSNPNFQGGDQGRDILKEPSNFKTGVESSYSQRQQNRKTITVVGGLLVACFSIAFALVGYILFNRRRSYRKNSSTDDDDNNHNKSFRNHSDDDYDLNHGHSYDTEDFGNGGRREEQHYDDEPNDNDEEYPNLPMSAEAIQMDLGNAYKTQMMMGVSPERGDYNNNNNNNNHSDLSHDVDDSDSWAQTDGTIGSLELQLEPITAEV